MKNNKLLTVVIGSLAAMSVHASGFGLYEMSAKSHALGGAVVGRAADASAVFYNPATLADLDKVTVTAGFVTQHPRGRMKVEGGGVSTPMDAGAFVLPHFNIAVPLPWDLVLGLGCAPEYGLGSEYDRNWELVNSSQSTTVQSLTLAPTLAWGVTKDLAIGFGLRFIWFDFEQYSEPVPGRLYHRLKGDNGMADLGWQAGIRYRILDNLSAGLVYKSQAQVNVEGKSAMEGLYDSWQHAKTDLMMPDSLTLGLNWDITKTWHLGTAVTWTQWSTIGTLDFNLGGSHVPCELDWDDTWRLSIAPSWDFADDWTWLFSYAYETDSTGEQKSTMLPAADRHMITTGVSWKCLENLEVTLGYGMIIMGGRKSHAADATGSLRDYIAHRGVSHAVGLSLTYTF